MKIYAIITSLYKDVLILSNEIWYIGQKYHSVFYPPRHLNCNLFFVLRTVANHFCIWWCTIKKNHLYKSIQQLQHFSHSNKVETVYGYTVYKVKTSQTNSHVQE